MPSDSSEVDAALTAKLLSDATLTGILTDGVFFDIAPQGAQKFLIVSHQAHEDVWMEWPGRAYEQFTYLVKAVTTSTSGNDVKTAAARIDALLEDGSLSITGYSLMNMKRTERIRYTELDEDKDLRWQHRGGLYQITVSPNA